MTDFTVHADPADIAEQSRSATPDVPADDAAPRPDSAAAEVDPADLVEQQEPVGAGQYHLATEPAAEAEPADAVEQAMVVPVDDEERDL